MDAGTDKAADLCLVTICAIRDFDIRATSSPAAAATLAHADEPTNPNDPNQPDNDATNLTTTTRKKTTTTKTTTL
jgi:hypothetical protein